LAISGHQDQLGANEQFHTWETVDPAENANQKLRVTPLRTGLDFYFHIDFDNLLDRELGLLLYALRPTEAYRHKIGLGKPLGLGTARIDPLGLFLVDRKQRYEKQTGFLKAALSPDTSRYHRLSLRVSKEEVERWPDEYARERETVAKSAGQVGALTW